MTSVTRVIDEAFIRLLEGHDLCVGRLMNGLFGGTRRVHGFGQSAEFADFRPYTPGDEFKRVDTNLYARFGVPIIRLCTDERQLHHRILLDTSASMAWGEPRKSISALRLCASLGYLAVQASDRVSVFTLSGTGCGEVCRNVTGREAFLRALSLLEDVRFRGNVDLGASILRCPGAGSTGGVDFLISDLLTDSDWRSAVDRLLDAGREVNIVRVLSPDEITPSLRGRLRLIGSEGDEYRGDFGRASTVAYRAAFDELTHDIQSFCASRGVGLCTISSDIPIGRVIFDAGARAGMTV